MAKIKLPWELRGSDFSKPGWHLEPTAGFELMIEYLRVSPSYELARKHNMEGLAPQEKLILPKDFEDVLKTYELFGDLRTTLFRQWWLKNGFRVFGSNLKKPQVGVLGFAMAGKDMHSLDLTSSIDEYLNNQRRDEGLPECLLASIPIGLKKAEIIKALLKTLAIHKTKNDLISQSVIKLEGKRLRAPVLLKGLGLLYMKAAKPSWENWRIGVLAQISPTYSKVLKYDDPKANSRPDEQYDRINMAKITVRDLRKFEKIAENAARRKFPSQEEIEYADFDYSALAKRVQAWSKWKKEEKQRLLINV